MRRALVLISCGVWLIAPLWAADQLPEGDAVRLPNKLVEFYSTPQGSGLDVHGKIFYAGERLYLRPAGSKCQGVLLRDNDRWLDVHWSPEGNFLGVENNWDTHECDVYIYEISLSPDRKTVNCKLVFFSPWNDVDRQWSIQGWHAKQRVVRLKLEQRGNDGIGGHEKWPRWLERNFAFPLGTRALIDTHDS